MAKVNTAVAKFAPDLGEKMAARQYDRQHEESPPRDRQGALFRPSEQTAVVGQTHGVGRRDSE